MKYLNKDNMENQPKHKNPTILLGLDSSGISCAAGVSTDSKLQGEISINNKNIHSEKLAIFIDFILDNLKISLEYLSGMIISAGPGSFTGLRIGYSLAKGIAHQLNIPLIEVPTLDVWAYQSGEQNQPIMPVIDAYRGEIFYSIYKWEKGQFSQINDYSITTIESLKQIINQNTLITGLFSEKLKSEISETLSPFAVFSSKINSSPSIRALLDLGYQKFVRQEFSDLNSCEPFYMRKFKGVS